jgi:phosphoenolpyruvate synthase/pyruvate phosphate dikinase
MQFIKPLAELAQSNLPEAGGKGAHLGALIQARFPVPPGFCITTDAYRAFVTANGLWAQIAQSLDSVKNDDPASLETSSAEIRAQFAAGRIPPGIAAEIYAAYLQLSSQSAGCASGLAVAVRSSATAEDLPDMSFAGQQDTYLNILGEEALLQAVVRCWGSLWTARAIGYRARNEIAHQDVALAVVVQQMVHSLASGVLFTANPLTGKRSETVIDATLGLGEALVSGQVEPDHYVVDAVGQRILGKTLGAKAVSIRGSGEGGTAMISENASDQQALPDAVILELAQLGRRVEQRFKTPQDVEWAWADGQLYLVQSRPITSLYPLPSCQPQPGHTEDSFLALFSFGVWQGMLEPYTPIGQDLLRGVVVGLSGQVGAATAALDTQRVIIEAGGRLYVNITSLMRNSFGRRFVKLFSSAIDPATSEAIEAICADPRLALRASHFTFRTRLRLVGELIPIVGNVILNLAWPALGRARLQRAIDAAIESTAARRATVANLADTVKLVMDTFTQLPAFLKPYLLPAVIAGQAALQTMYRQVAALPEGEQMVMALTRGLPHNVTTEMDLALWDTARSIKQDAAAAEYLTSSTAATLALEYLDGKLPAAAQAVTHRFMQQYGMRGIAEIDLGRPRWREDPAYIMQVLKSYLQIEETHSSPQAIFQRSVAEAKKAQAQLIRALRQMRGGWLRARLVQLQIGRVRELAGLRETPKFTLVRVFWYLREALLASGVRLAAAGVLAQPDDIFFLYLSELEKLASGVDLPWRALVAERRQGYAREKRRRRVPCVLLSDGTAFYEGMPADDGANVITGSPVSPGVTEGAVSVVFDPYGAQLSPGEILVCPATDPAWTPLFLAAGGLIMEVGGMMTHGSVVAREYGIPAVVGVREATTRLKTGQRIRLDGSTGQIVILGEAYPSVSSRQGDIDPL